MCAPPDLEGAEIVIPASVSNLGAGFDTLAVAVQMYLRVRVREVGGGVNGEMAFEFADRHLEGENFIERAFLHQARRHSARVPSLRVEVRSEIPMRAGLGSSAAATVAGLKLYERVTRSLSRDLLTTATTLEGHPDNASASLYGGLTVSWQLADGSARARAHAWPDSVRFVLAIPQVRLETTVARGVLPASIPRIDAVFNLQRVALLLSTITTGEYQDLKEALRDRWHQPFRQSLVPGLEEALMLEHPDLLGVCLSGSGPIIVALAERNFPEIETLLRRVYERLHIPCEVKTVAAHQPMTEGCR